MLITLSERTGVGRLCVRLRFWSNPRILRRLGAPHNQFSRRFYGFFKLKTRFYV